MSSRGAFMVLDELEVFNSSSRFGARVQRMQEQSTLLGLELNSPHQQCALSQ